MVVVPPAKAALVPEFRSSAKSSPRKLVQGSMPPGIINFSVASMTFAPEKKITKFASTAVHPLSSYNTSVIVKRCNF